MTIRVNGARIVGSLQKIAMSLSKVEAKQLLERMIFNADLPQSWAQDVWDMSPTLGETAAKLVDILEALIDCCPEEQLNNLLQGLYHDRM